MNMGTSVGEKLEDSKRDLARPLLLKHLHARFRV